MLAEHNRTSQLTGFLDSLPCQLCLPEEWSRQMAGDGFLLPRLDDRRRFLRISVKAPLIRAGLEYQHTLPAIPRVPNWYAVYLLDISRSGVRFLHFEQLYPHECFRILLADGTQKDIAVARCQRVGERCYDVGVRFCAAEPHARA